jgi:hypothetical protein
MSTLKMNNTYKLSEALEDPQHEAHEPAKDFIFKLESGEINLCGCLGAMYGEPYCPCEMVRKGLQDVMDTNPLRIAENVRYAEEKAAFEARGGWKQLLRNGKK